MFRHHDREHDKPLTEAERETLISEGATSQGLIMHKEPSPADSQKSQVRLVVRFKDNQSVEFVEDLDNLYQPAPGSPEADRLTEMRKTLQVNHPDRIPKIQLPISSGERVPVRFDEANRNKLVVDVPALRKQALRDYIKQEQRQKEQKEQQPQGARTGPPWVVPTHCPNCGAPVDQAKASRDPDPMCQFCSQPIPVSPVS